MGGDVGDFLFGKESEPGRVENRTPEAFKQLQGPLRDQLRSIFSQGGTPAYEGPFTAGIGEGEQALLDRITGQGTRRSPLTEAAREQLGRTISGEGLSPQSNPFLEATIEAATRPAFEAFERETMPGLRSLFTRSGQQVQDLGSSPFAEAAAIARSGLANTVSDTASEIAFGNYQRERGRQQEATMAAPEFDRAELDSALKSLEAAALPRMVEQYGIDRGLEEFRRRQQALLEAIRMAGGVAQPTIVTTQPMPGSSGAVDYFVQGLGQGMGSMAGG